MDAHTLGLELGDTHAIAVVVDGTGCVLRRAEVTSRELTSAALAAIDGAAPGSPGSLGVAAINPDTPECRAVLDALSPTYPGPYAQDGAVFGNREGILPKQKRGYYREYTVKTPGERTRGARRIVSGGPEEHYYTADHYASFRQVLR